MTGNGLKFTNILYHLSKFMLMTSWGMGGFYMTLGIRHMKKGHGSRPFLDLDDLEIHCWIREVPHGQSSIVKGSPSCELYKKLAINE